MTITIDRLEYRYPNATAPTLQVDALDIADGEFCLVAGPSAGGKSTLLRTINGLIPQFHGGAISGTIRVAGADPIRTPTREMARLAGMVFQEPEAQGVADVVEEEVAFAMEQHGVPTAEMRRRLGHLLDALGIASLRHRRLSTLSGGERQRVAIAAVLALEPSVLLLDEPTSQLDPAGADAVLAAIQQLHESRGLTVLLAEHRLERLLPAVQRVIEVELGRARAMTPRLAAAELAAVPPVCELGRRFGAGPVPLTVEEARAVLPPGLEARVAATPSTGDVVLCADGLTVRYGEYTALDAATFGLREGEIVALVGPNGSGKSTLFRALAGLIEPHPGNITLAGSPASASVQQRTAFAALVPQDPAIALYHDTVREEVGDTLRHRKAAGRDIAAAVDACLAGWDLAALGGSNPRDLSVGQQQRVAIAAMLPHNPPVWLLDEPTRGADVAAREWLARRVREHAASGGGAIVATHDLESAATYATRVIALRDGRIEHDLPARTAFSADGPFATQTARLVPGAITPAEVTQ